MPSTNKNLLDKQKKRLYDSSLEQKKSTRTQREEIQKPEPGEPKVKKTQAPNKPQVRNSKPPENAPDLSVSKVDAIKTGTSKITSAAPKNNLKSSDTQDVLTSVSNEQESETTLSKDSSSSKSGPVRKPRATKSTKSTKSTKTTRTTKAKSTNS